MLDQRSIDKVVLILLFFMSVCMSTVTANDPYDNHGESDSCSSAKTDWDDQEEDDEIIILDNFSLLNRYDFLTKNPWNNPTVFKLRPKYAPSGFHDNTHWHELLNFMDWHYYEFSKQEFQKSNYEYEKECNKIISISIVFLSGKQVPACLDQDFRDYIDEDFLIDVKDEKILRLFEIFLRDVKIPVRLVPQFPPSGVITAPYQRDYAMGHVLIHTKKGDFTIELKRNGFRLTSERTTMQYKFHSQGIALLLDKILHDKKETHIPEKSLKYWSGDFGDEKIIKTYLDPKYDYTSIPDEKDDIDVIETTSSRVERYTNDSGRSSPIDVPPPKNAESNAKTDGGR